MNDPIVECGQCGAFLEQPRRKPVSMSKPVSPPTDTTVGLGRMAQHRFLCDLGHQLFLAQPKGSPLLHFSIFSTSKVRMGASAICGDVQADVSLVDNPWLWKIKIFAAVHHRPDYIGTLVYRRRSIEGARILPVRGQLSETFEPISQTSTSAQLVHSFGASSIYDAYRGMLDSAFMMLRRMVFSSQCS